MLISVDCYWPCFHVSWISVVAHWTSHVSEAPQNVGNLFDNKDTWDWNLNSARVGTLVTPSTPSTVLPRTRLALGKSSHAIIVIVIVLITIGPRDLGHPKVFCIPEAYHKDTLSGRFFPSLGQQHTKNQGASTHLHPEIGKGHRVHHPGLDRS